MPLKKLPKGGNDFRVSGRHGFSQKLSSMTRFGRFSNLKDNKKDITRIFESLTPTLRRDGKIPLSTRRRAFLEFSRISGVSKQDQRDFKKILDSYK